MLVHVGGASDPVLLPVRDDPRQLVLVANVHLGDILNVAAFLVLSDLEIVLAYVEQVPYFLHVELEYRQLYLELDRFRTLFDGLEKSVDLSAYDSCTIRGIIPLLSFSLKS